MVVEPDASEILTDGLMRRIADLRDLLSPYVGE